MKQFTVCSDTTTHGTTSGECEEEETNIYDLTDDSKQEELTYEVMQPACRVQHSNTLQQT